MFSRRGTTVFSKARVSDLFENVNERIKAAIERESENYILNVNETDYVNHLVDTYTLDTPEIHFDDLYADSYEKKLSGEYFPTFWHVERDKEYNVEVIRFYLPCSGDIQLLYYCPSTIILSGGGQFEISGNNLISEHINFSKKPEEITNSFKSDERSLRQQYENLKKDIENFNKSLKNKVASKFKERKQKFLSKNNFLSALGVPLKKKDNISKTFSVPKPQLREKIVVKPVVYEKGFKAEPVLDDTNYRNVLKIINDVGKNFERMPSVYKEKGEEDLRDHILMLLDPNFELGSASGETFNKAGKTDIQLRHDSSVVFIAECKFWKGEKSYHATIDQLLSYLTWRDTKGAVVIFVQQKDCTTILEKVKLETPKHPNYLGFVNASDENWFNYRFHLNGDKNRELKLAVQLFHLPK